MVSSFHYSSSAANEHAPCRGSFLLTVKAACESYFCSPFSPYLTLTTQVQIMQGDRWMFSVEEAKSASG